MGNGEGGPNSPRPCSPRTVFQLTSQRPVQQSSRVRCGHTCLRGLRSSSVATHIARWTDAPRFATGMVFETTQTNWKPLWT